MKRSKFMVNPSSQASRRSPAISTVSLDLLTCYLFQEAKLILSISYYLLLTRRIVTLTNNGFLCDASNITQESLYASFFQHYHQVSLIAGLKLNWKMYNGTSKKQSYIVSPALIETGFHTSLVPRPHFFPLGEK